MGCSSRMHGSECRRAARIWRALQQNTAMLRWSGERKQQRAPNPSRNLCAALAGLRRLHAPGRLVSWFRRPVGVSFSSSLDGVRVRSADGSLTVASDWCWSRCALVSHVQLQLQASPLAPHQAGNLKRLPSQLQPYPQPCVHASATALDPRALSVREAACGSPWRGRQTRRASWGHARALLHTRWRLCLSATLRKQHNCTNVKNPRFLPAFCRLSACLLRMRLPARSSTHSGCDQFCAAG